MATRYSGNTKVTITYLDNEDRYKATVSAGGKRKTVYVGRVRGVSADSKAGYDSAASAAISFAIDEGLDADPDYNERGNAYVLRRGPKRRR
jgi:hypothetical protein